MENHKPERPTRTAATEAMYRKRYDYVERLAIAARKRVMLAQGGMYDLVDQAKTPTPQEVAAAFLEMEPKWGAATAKLYRAALTFVFETDQIEGAAQAREFIYHEHVDREWYAQHVDALKAARRNRQKLHPRNAQQKAKRFSKEKMAELMEHLRGSHSRWNQATIDWFSAGALTGLRPSEWRRAELVYEKGRLALRVQNAKATNDRAHSQFRTLPFADLSESQVELIRRHIETVRLYDRMGKYESLFEGCRQLIRDAADRVFPKSIKHPTLYTARHMFAADAKSVFGKVEVAAMMGHASTETAGRHYARRSGGSGSLGVVPADSDVDAVMQRNPGEPLGPARGAEAGGDDGPVSPSTPGGRDRN